MEKGLEEQRKVPVRLMKIYIEEEIISISHIVTARTRDEALRLWVEGLAVTRQGCTYLASLADHTNTSSFYYTTNPSTVSRYCTI